MSDDYARTAALTDIIRGVLRLLSNEHSEPHAHLGDDIEYAEDQIVDAARRLVEAVGDRNGR